MEQINEKELTCFDGWVILMGQIFFITLVILFSNPFLLGFSIFILIFLSSGFFINNPNEAIVGTLLGKYRGSLKNNGFFWINPFIKKAKVSLKINTINTDLLKINDKNGNSLDIKAVFIWKISDCAKALFYVEDYESYLSDQIDSTLRKIIGNHCYDGNENSLRSNIEDINRLLKDSLSKIIYLAGLEVIESKIISSSYSPDVAQIMLNEQKTKAIIKSRKEIVDASVTIISDALIEIEDLELAEFSNNDKVNFITNLMLVLASDKENKI